MQFLAPLFFAALAGLAIPVLLHLTQREKKQIIRFPSLMFVRRIPYQSVRRRKIQNWLLLMVRMAALAMIILAYTAVPIFRGRGERTRGRGSPRHQLQHGIRRSLDAGAGRSPRSDRKADCVGPRIGRVVRLGR